jgi:hypothetical protein
MGGRWKNDTASTSPLRFAAKASTVLGALVVASTLAGLFVPGFYRLVNPVLLPGSYGQDWMSLAALPALAWAVRVSRRGSLRGVVVWLGLLAYYEYAYALYAFGPQLTALYPLYVAIVSLSNMALVALTLSLDISAFHGRLYGHLPTRQIVLLFGAIVIFLAPVWVAMMIAGIQEGKPSLFATVHVLDLAFVFPALIVAAIGLWRHRPWSYVLAGPMLVLAATMMGSLIISEIIAAARFTPDPLPLALVFVIIAMTASFLTHTYLRELRS